MNKNWEETDSSSASPFNSYAPKEKLQIISQPPSVVVVNQKISMGVWLDSSKENCSNKLPTQKLSDESGPEDGSVEAILRSDCIDINAQIERYEETQNSQLSDAKESIFLTTDPCLPVKLTSQKMTTFSCIITTKSLLQNADFKERYCIRLSDTKNTGNTVRSRPFKLATYKFEVKAENWDEIWYKDEGGREKCMQVTVSLYDGNNNLVKGRQIPLKLTLLYENNDDRHMEVMRQEILQISGPRKSYIKPDQGSTSLRFRIEDVSKNHQGQNFKVFIEEDTASLSGIAPSCTPSVSIRSKRKKRSRTKSDNTSGGGTRTDDVAPEQRGDRSTDVEKSSSQPVPYQLKARDTDLKRLRNAMTGVIRWTEEVVNNLYPLQWQIVGYAPLPDGGYDYNNPKYSMPNPNTCIAKILEMYSESTREDLRVLISAVKNAGNDSLVTREATTATSSTTGPSAGSIRSGHGVIAALAPNPVEDFMANDGNPTLTEKTG